MFTRAVRQHEHVPYHATSLTLCVACRTVAISVCVREGEIIYDAYAVHYYSDSTAGT